MTQEVDPIPPEQAREILEAAIRERLGENWDDEETGWMRVTGHDYMTRLSRGRVNLDFYVDLLGNVRVEITESQAAVSARLLLFILLGLSLVIAYLIVRIVAGT
jgi:hypothetical protein